MTDPSTISPGVTLQDAVSFVVTKGGSLFSGYALGRGNKVVAGVGGAVVVVTELTGFSLLSLAIDGALFWAGWRAAKATGDRAANREFNRWHEGKAKA